MTHLTPDQTALLREILGLWDTNRINPTRNRSYSSRLSHDEALTASLVDRGYLTKHRITGPVDSYSYTATPAGIEAVRDQRWAD